MNFFGFILVFAGAVGTIAAQQAPSINLGNSPLFHGESAGYPMGMDAPTVAPLFLETEHFTSTLHLVNDAITSEPATIIVRTADGDAVTTTLTLTGHEALVLPLKTLLKGKVARRGSLELYATDPLGSSLAGQLEIVYSGEERRAAIDEELLMPSMTTSHMLRGVSLQSDASPIIAVSNVSDRPVVANMTCNYAGGLTASVPLQFGRRETKFLTGCVASTQVGDAEAMLMQAPENATDAQPIGIQIASDDPKSELQAFGITPHTILGHRYFSAINFTDPKELNSSQFVYAGIPTGYYAALGNVFTPQFSFSNFSGSEKTVTVRTYSSAGGLAPLGNDMQVAVPAHGSITLPVKLEANASDLRSYVTTATGAPGEVIGALIDQSDTGNNRFLVIGKDPSTDLNAGMHPWIADAEHRAMLVAFNHGGIKQDVTIRIGTGNGAIWQRKITLQPYQTLTQDINQLLASKDNRDDRSSTLPKTLTQGEVSWWTEDARRVTGRLIQIDSSDNLVRNFSCYGQIVLCTVIASATPSSGLVGTQFYFQGSAYNCTTNYGGTSVCNGPTAGGTSGTFSWSTYGSFQNNSSTTNSVYSTAIAPGNGTANVQVTSGMCTATGQAPVTVGPPIPVNFMGRLTKTASGLLQYQYSWQSSTGNLSDLKGCTAGETVFYQGSDPTYNYPAPMVVNYPSPNPTVLYGSAVGGGFQDQNKPPDSYSKPYMNASFQAIQRLQWQCPNYQNGAFQRFVPDLTITRAVTQVNGVWTYQITKGNDTNSAVLP